MLATKELLAEAAQRSRLTEHLSQVLRRVPLYSRPGAQSSDGLAHVGGLPFISKADIRTGFPDNFLGPETGLEQLLEDESIELEHTSGTSEPRTPLLLPRGWWAEQERRALRLNPVVAEALVQTPDPRRVTISSPVCSSDICFTRVPSRTERIVGNTLFLSFSRYPFLWSEGDLARMAAEAVAWQPEFLDLDPVYGTVFALYCERRGIRFSGLKFVLCSYEFLSVVHRRILGRVFNVPVFNLYGSTETGHLLMEDERGEMRPSLETACLEVIDFAPSQTECDGSSTGRQVEHKRAGGQDVALNVLAPGGGQIPETGELVVTTLTNEVMPLVRYRIGDLVERRLEPYRTRYVVHGRAADAFVVRGGGRVTTWQVDQCFAGVEGVVHYQLLERVDAPWVLRFVPERGGPSAAAVAGLRSELQALLQWDAPLGLEPTDKLLAESSGKFRLGYPASSLGTAGLAKS